MADGKFPKQAEEWSVRGVGIYPWLFKADTKFNAKGVYRVKHRTQTADIAAIEQRMIKLATEFKEWYLANKTPADAIGKRKNAVVKSPFAPVYDKDGNVTGESDANYKMNAIMGPFKDGTIKKQSPKVWDGKGQPTKRNPYTGSILKIVWQPDPYYKADNNEFGISLRMKGVQIIKLVTGGDEDRDAASFGLQAEDDGFVDDGFDDNSEAMPSQENAPTSGTEESSAPLASSGNPADF